MMLLLSQPEIKNQRYDLTVAKTIEIIIGLSIERIRIRMRKHRDVS